MARKRIVTVHSHKRVFDGRYKIDEAVFSFDRAAGPGRIEKARRLVFERGDSAAVLLHDVARDMIIVAEQFRYATYAKGPGYILEAVAGSVEEGEAPDDCIRRELMEEVGYQVQDLTLIGSFYVSPGATSERIFLYYAKVTPDNLVDPEASGLAAEKEDVKRVEFTREDFLARLEAGRFQDGKILTAGFWLKAQPRQGKPRRR